ncbi:TetR/AcrR family transcriptional regulator [Planctomonas deserti]|uniref:TetR/AcrR family transcriptional regulator n=1 Tax=Planctomonas deserti TaxID=2144185 RepID=UPI000D349268|nr:TetR/AcrR family transcriptional regulator [Planctomonas deserti]
MPDTRAPRRGRPTASSRADLEDAAAELFLERTYAATSVADITQRAGVSRTTFFNYFTAKSDVLWSTFDTHIGRLTECLADAAEGTPAMAAVRAAFLRVVAPIGPESVPWALTQQELMGTREVLESSGLRRFMEQAAVLRRFLAGRTGLPASDARVQSAAFAALGAVAAAAGAWAGDGVGRRPLRDYVDEALSPVCAGFDAAFDRSDERQAD